MDQPFTIERGYRPAIVGRLVTLHAQYYSQNFDFGLEFEAKVASEAAAHLSHINSPKNEIWCAVQDNDIVGTIAIQGQDADIAHLRWFITADSARGTGAGRALFEAAMAFVDDNGFRETRLWTFKGLTAARAMYEGAGFVLDHEAAGNAWGVEVLEQHFTRARR